MLILMEILGMFVLAATLGIIILFDVKQAIFERFNLT